MGKIRCKIFGHKNINWKDVPNSGHNRLFIDQVCVCERCGNKTRRTSNKINKMKIIVEYIIDDENMSDEEYETQEDKTVEITASDLNDILTYGYFNNQVPLSKTQTIAEITEVSVKY